MQEGGCGHALSRKEEPAVKLPFTARKLGCCWAALQALAMACRLVSAAVPVVHARAAMVEDLRRNSKS